MPMERYSLFVLKVPLNTNQPFTGRMPFFWLVGHQPSLKTRKGFNRALSECVRMVD